MINIKIIIITAVMIVIFIMTCYFNRAIRSISITIITNIMNIMDIIMIAIKVIIKIIFEIDIKTIIIMNYYLLSFPP